MFIGPLMTIGLCVVGLAMLWARPFYGFALTYAVGLFAYTVVSSTFYLGGLAAFQGFFGGFVISALALSLTFLAIGAAIVALKKRAILARTAA